MKYFISAIVVAVSAVVLFRITHADEQSVKEPSIEIAQTQASRQDTADSGFNVAVDSNRVKHVELGAVRWHRDFDKAVALSKRTGKPLAILFQEIPGCAGCQKYGRQVLSDPLIVEVLEDSFVPVAVFNNAGGRDREILTRFKEPTWNYQVMRFTEGDLKELIPRKDQVWTVPATAQRLAHALRAAKQQVPTFLTDVVLAERNPQLQTAVFAMYCFWTGEARLGALDGVISTEAGFYDGREVVMTRYDPKKINLVTLTRKAAAIDCAHAVYVPDDEAVRMLTGATRLSNVQRFDHRQYRRAPKSDQKKQLQSTRGLAQLGLTPMQWTKLNSSVVSRDGFSRWLSPRQLASLTSTFAIRRVERVR